MPRTTPCRSAFAALLFGGLAAFQTLAAAQNQPFVGQIVCGAFSFAPRGFALANGQVLPISSNTALFSLLGTTYGGNGISTFALPNLQGASMLGQGQGPGRPQHVLGETGGATQATLQAANLPAHQHPFTRTASTADATLVLPAGAVPSTKARGVALFSAGPGNTTMAAVASDPAGVSAPVPVPVETPYLTVNCFIALQGIFPPRN
jgi:microcystin-dependent protein